MKYLKQLAIILGFAFAGELLRSIIPAPIPASVYGLILLFAALCTGVVKVSQIKETSTFLLAIMSIMFVPASVGLIESWDVIASNAAAYFVIAIVTTLLVMAVSGGVTQLLMKGKHHHE